MKKKALIVEAHSDDSAISATGFLEKFKKKYDYHFAVLTVSDIYLHHCQRTVSRAERIEEYDRFVNHFNGIWERGSQLPFDYDAKMDTIPKALIVREIEEIISNVKPDLLICQGPSFHHDHTIVYEATIAATRPTARHCPSQILIMENPTYVHSLGPATDFKPDYYCSLNRQQMEQKIQVFKKYFPSQVREEESYLSPQGILSWARYRGIECRREYAEAFQIYQIVV